MFLLFTSSGEGSCFDGTSTSCAYTQYCAYHGYFGSPISPVIYGNMPYADLTYCFASGQELRMEISMLTAWSTLQAMK